MKIIPEEKLSPFSSCGCPPQLFFPLPGLLLVRTTASSTELQTLTTWPILPPLVTPHSRVYSLQTINGNKSDICFFYVDTHIISSDLLF